MSGSVLMLIVTMVNVSYYLAFRGMCSVWNTSSSPGSTCLAYWIISCLHAMNTIQ